MPHAPASPKSTDTSDASPRADALSRRWVLWLLVAIGAAVALAALWVALFGNPSVVGGQVASGAATGSGASSIAATGQPAPPLTVADVRSVLGDLDYERSRDSTLSAYDDAVARLVRSVDLVEFARATLDATAAISWTDMGASRSRLVSGAEKDELVAESLDHWKRFRSTTGSDADPLADALAASLYPPSVGDRNRADSLFAVMAQGLRPLGLLSGARSPSGGWTWRVVGVSVTGTDTASVTYSASADPSAGWSFADSGARYTKQLRFSRSPQGRWRLAAWTNFSAIDAQFRNNVRPRGAAVRFDRWWGAL
jgi:hypothetical protein